MDVELMRERHYHARTQAVAYALWEQAGRPEGQALGFWLEAERWLERWK